MKRVAVSMMVACAIAGLSGCGNKEDSSSASGSNVAKVGFINGTTGAVADMACLNNRVSTWQLKK